jgi:hypothetical protein
MNDVAHHPLLNRRTRTGTPEEQGVSTYRLARQAVAEARFQDAIELGRHAHDETRLTRHVYPRWLDGIRAFLARKGVEPGVIESEDAAVLDKARMPDGSAPDMDTHGPIFDGHVDAFVAACELENADDAQRELEAARLAWVQLHDSATDRVTGMLDVVFRLVGEDHIADVWDELMADWYAGRDAYATTARPWETSLEILLPDTTESLRGHMTGPDRAGDVEVIEEEDRWIFRFAPCGSGGRMISGDPGSPDSPPRSEPPFNFGVTTRGHDWSWGKEGVCLYCVHCCQAQERIPIERIGYPIRVVDPPTYPDDRGDAVCTWSVYKDPSLIPEEAYRRVGATRPSSFADADEPAGRDHDDSAA